MSKELNFINFDGKEINLYDERETYLDQELVIKNCPNLVEIDVGNCGLKELIIKDCSKLQKIDAYSNNLTEFKITNFPNLVRLSIEKTLKTLMLVITV